MLDEQGMVRDLQFEVRIKVCMLLNNPNVENNYKMLAGEMGYPLTEIKTFELKENPTDIFLQHWGTRSDSTIGRLIEHLNTIDRGDVIDVLYGR